MKKNTTLKAFPASDNRWTELSIELSQHLHDALANFLIELGADGVVSDEEITDPPSGTISAGSAGCNRLSAYLKNNDQLSARLTAIHRYLASLAAINGLSDIPPVKLTLIREEDWGTTWQQLFSTCRIGRQLVVKPSWEVYLPHGNDIMIEMDPGMAFGTGTHPTTRMCLEVIESLAHRSLMPISSMLDVGTGSGILSIAAAKLGVEKIVGIDIDPVALNYARQNIVRNKVGHRVEVRDCSLEKIEERFDLIAANILSETLIALRTDLLKRSTAQGILLLSGILVEKAYTVETAFSSRQCAVLETRAQGDWACVVLQKQLA